MTIDHLNFLETYRNKWFESHSRILLESYPYTILQRFIIFFKAQCSNVAMRRRFLAEIDIFISRSSKDGSKYVDHLLKGQRTFKLKRNQTPSYVNKLHCRIMFVG